MDFGHSELDVGPGIFHVLSPKAPTEPNVVSPKATKSRGQAEAPVAASGSSSLMGQHPSCKQHFTHTTGHYLIYL